MKQVNKRVLEAFARLEGDTDFEQIIGWLKESLNTSEKVCREEADDVKLRQAQGSAQVLSKIVETAGDARGIIQKHKDQNTG